MTTVKHTKSGEFMVVEVDGGFYFCPDDRDWLTEFFETDYSQAYPTAEAALAAAEMWEGSDQAASV